MKRAAGSLLRAVGWLLNTASLLLGVGVFLWALALWGEVWGVLGVIFGLFAISDVALPFAYHAGQGVWPTAWLLTVAAAVACRLVGVVLAAAGGVLLEAARGAGSAASTSKPDPLPVQGGPGLELGPPSSVTNPAQPHRGRVSIAVERHFQKPCARCGHAPSKHRGRGSTRLADCHAAGCGCAGWEASRATRACGVRVMSARTGASGSATSSGSRMLNGGWTSSGRPLAPANGPTRSAAHRPAF